MKIEHLDFVKEDYLNLALSEMSEGFRCLLDVGSKDIFTASIISTASSSFDFSDARTRFERVNTYTALLMRSHLKGITVNGASFSDHIDWILSNSEVTKNWCERIYKNSNSKEDRLEQVYQLHDSYCTAIGNLKNCLRLIKEGEIKVHWIGCESPPEIPELPSPKSLTENNKP